MFTKLNAIFSISAATFIATIGMTAGQCLADGPQGSGRYPMIAHPGCHNCGYYSWRLQTRFVIEQTSIPSFPVPFYAARLVSDPNPGSSLHQAGLRAGDWIVRLDGVHVNNFQELEGHVDVTTVRSIRRGAAYADDSTIFISQGYTGSSTTPPFPYAPAPRQ